MEVIELDGTLKLSAGKAQERGLARTALALETRVRNKMRINWGSMWVRTRAADGMTQLLDTGV